MSFAGFGTALGNLLSGTANSLEDKQKREAMLQEVAMKMRAQQMQQLKDANDMQMGNAKAYHDYGYVPTGGIGATPQGGMPQMQMPQTASFGIGAPPTTGASAPSSPFSIAPAPTPAAPMPMGTGRPPEVYPGAGFGFNTPNGLTPSAAVAVAQAGAIKTAEGTAEQQVKTSASNARYQRLKEGIAKGEMPEIANFSDAKLHLMADNTADLMLHYRESTPAEQAQMAQQLGFHNSTIAQQLKQFALESDKFQFEKTKYDIEQQRKGGIAGNAMMTLARTAQSYGDLSASLDKMKVFENDKDNLAKIAQYAGLANMAMQDVKTAQTGSLLDAFGRRITAQQIANAQVELQANFKDYWQYLQLVKRTGLALTEVLPRPNRDLLGLEMSLSGIGAGAVDSPDYIKDVQDRRDRAYNTFKQILTQTGNIDPETGMFIAKGTATSPTPQNPPTVPGKPPTGPDLVKGHKGGF